MAAYLVTHSLLSSWLHLIRENPYEDLTTEGDPLAEFMLVLRREPTPRTEAMQNGIDFENLVTAIVNGHDDPNNPWNWAAGQIAAIIKGGQLQFKARRTIQVRGMDVVLYGHLRHQIQQGLRARKVLFQHPAPNLYAAHSGGADVFLPCQQRHGRLDGVLPQG